MGGFVRKILDSGLGGALLYFILAAVITVYKAHDWFGVMLSLAIFGGFSGVLVRGIFWGRNC
jgi:hypothetical protein